MVCDNAIEPLPLAGCPGFKIKHGFYFKNIICLSLNLSHISLNTSPIVFILPPLQPPSLAHSNAMRHCHPTTATCHVSIIFPFLPTFFNIFVRHLVFDKSRSIPLQSCSYYHHCNPLFALFPTPCDTATQPLPLAMYPSFFLFYPHFSIFLYVTLFSTNLAQYRSNRVHITTITTAFSRSFQRHATLPPTHCHSSCTPPFLYLK
jgi:hypothetical protein